MDYKKSSYGMMSLGMTKSSAPSCGYTPMMPEAVAPATYAPSPVHAPTSCTPQAVSPVQCVPQAISPRDMYNYHMKMAKHYKDLYNYHYKMACHYKKMMHKKHCCY